VAELKIAEISKKKVVKKIRPPRLTCAPPESPRSSPGVTTLNETLNPVPLRNKTTSELAVAVPGIVAARSSTYANLLHCFVSCFICHGAMKIADVGFRKSIKRSFTD
jgi:hypothetical protein